MSRAQTETNTIPNPEQVQIKPDPASGRVAVPTAEDMFLSPRVMDASAFSKYSETLKSIITHATNQGRTLEDFAADAEEMIRRAAESEKTIDKRLQAGMRLLTLLDERTEQTNSVLEQSAAQLPEAEELERRVQNAVSDIVVQSTKAIEQAAADAEARARRAQAGADASAERLETLLASLESRAAELESRVHTAEKHAADSGSTLEDRVESCEDRIARTLDAAVGTAESRAAKIQQQLTLGTSSMSAELDALRAALEPVRETARRACEALGMNPDAPDINDSPIARIESIVERGEKNIAGADRLFRQLEELRQQAESVKSDFGVWLTEAADQLDALETRRDVLERPIADAAKSLEGFTPDVEARINDAQRTLEELSTHAEMLSTTVVDASSRADSAKHDLANQSAALQAVLDGSINKLTERVELAGQWLGTLITQARESAATLGGDPNNTTLNTNLRIAREESTQPRVTAPATTSTTERADPTNPTNHTDHTDHTNHLGKPSESPGMGIPERLPIDSLSFDGSTHVVEHTEPEHSETEPVNNDELYPGAD